MRLTTIRLQDGDGMTTAAGRLDGDLISVLPYPDVGALLAAGPDWRERAAQAGDRTVPVSEASFAPLVPRPEKVLCVGANYRDHIAEAGMEVPRYPTLFAKYARSLIGPYDDIVLPANSDAVDWEVELGVVIGEVARNIDREAAWDVIAGYTIVNDISMRDWQLRTSQFLQGKTFEASTPVGPYLVTPDEVGHARAADLTCAVDDDVMQKSVTSELVFSAAEIVSYISSFITLVPGDLIATGTPGGVGAARKPPLFLTDGQTLTSRIDGLGEQVNRCVAESR
ncbi:ureidoglycolate lyase [Actinomadura sp. NBRC 104412]|uniref:fumarylacetoacetate hydrolase family protein n=1 Tax=Actinomadura sp. NBRC 104412 TaxID=3032203 RepID=UPI0024A1F8E8|nr:fumarylacetoacetate hydrolase family protein [Actinomadura sp. NBRC 104412]GLZ09087.1 ureidoglycolate lyase [Actinomadura sp. NBRC 104412]